MLILVSPSIKMGFKQILNNQQRDTISLTWLAKEYAVCSGFKTIVSFNSSDVSVKGGVLGLLQLPGTAIQIFYYNFYPKYTKYKFYIQNLTFLSIQ